jgi:hypothetical protein
MPISGINNYMIMEKHFDKLQYERVKRKVKEIKSFYYNLTCYCTVIPVLIFINLTYSPQFYWFLFSAFGWGIGLVIHGLMAFDYIPFLGYEWQERKIRELMEKEGDTNRKFN